MSFILKIATKTDKGKVYSHNEDSVFAKLHTADDDKSLALLIVADGVGGHKAGEVASKIVVDTITKDFDDLLNGDFSEIPGNEINLNELKKKLVASIIDANTTIHNYSQDNNDDAENLGSTVTTALVFGKDAIIANVGDSRTYHYHDGRFEQVTNDHSLVSEMVQKKIIKPEEIFTHPLRSVITRALGNEPEIDIDTFRVSLNPGNRLLLCSDGLWEMIHSSSELSDLLYSDANLDKVATAMVRKANGYGGKDNIGVVVAEYNEA